MFDVQWVLGGPAEWSSPFSIVQCLMFKGSRVVMPNDHPFFCSMSNVQWVSGSHAEWPSFLLFNVDAESVSSIVTLLVICPILTCVYFT